MADIEKIKIEATVYDIKDASVHKGEPNKTWQTNTNGVGEWKDAKCISEITFEELPPAEPEKFIYGFSINSNESSPDAAITYLEDAVGKIPAKMNFLTGIFEYGDWADAFFMPKPCMLRYNGTVDYYLNPNDYTKRLDGSPSDVNNTSYNGNAMMEWGQNGQIIWYKTEINNENPDITNVFIANYQADEDYVCWSFINNEGWLAEHFYTPIYQGSVVKGTLRSMSGLYPAKNYTATQEINYAVANNTDGDKSWYIETYADRILINLLLILISKSLDSKSVFGQGNNAGYVNDATQNYGQTQSGFLNDKGLFYGSEDNTTAVKVFGMENWWGNAWRRTAGYILDNGIQKVKFTYGTEDGSTVVGYNDTANGYLTLSTNVISASDGFIKKMNYDQNAAALAETGGSSSTYYCCGTWMNKTIKAYALYGGHASGKLNDGAFSVYLAGNVSRTGWGLGASISCKP